MVRQILEKKTTILNMRTKERSGMIMQTLDKIQLSQPKCTRQSKKMHGHDADDLVTTTANGD